MKRTQLRLVALICLSGLTFSSVVAALTTDNPYSAIANRNAFALKPPVVVTNTPTAPEAAPAGIELQGITTILGKPQVFLKIKQPPRPPKPAEDVSVVLEAGDREGEVQVISIDAAAGIVRLENRGAALALNMKDNAATPTAAPVTTPAVPGLGLPRPPGLPAPAGVIPQPRPATTQATTGVSSATTIGGASQRATPAGTSNVLPTRSVRSGTDRAAQYSNQPATAQPLSREEQAALILANKEKWRQLGREDISNLIPNPIPNETPQ